MRPARRIMSGMGDSEKKRFCSVAENRVVDSKPKSSGICQPHDMEADVSFGDEKFFLSSHDKLNSIGFVPIVKNWKRRFLSKLF